MATVHPGQEIQVSTVGASLSRYRTPDAAPLTSKPQRRSSPLGTTLGRVVALLLVLAATSAHAGPSFTATVVRVVDGDTISVQFNGRTEKVRYIGMDTPETKHPIKGEQPGGREASAVNRGLVEGKTVRLELDVRERDRRRRLLAYVYVGDMMVNEELVRLGYAQVMTIPPNVAYQSRFLKLQREAREAARGLWAQPQCSTGRIHCRLLSRERGDRAIAKPLSRPSDSRRSTAHSRRRAWPP